MSSEKPRCLPECRVNDEFLGIKENTHAPGCPNAEAPKVEERFAPIRVGSTQSEDNRRTEKLLEELEARAKMFSTKPAPAEAPKADHSEQPLNMAPVDKAGEVDFEAADRWAEEWFELGSEDATGNLALAYLTLKDEVIDHEQTERALRAEMSALKSDVDWHRSGRDECRKDRETLRADLAAEKAERDRAEARVRELEDLIVEKGEHFPACCCVFDEVRRAILAARQSEREKA